MDYSGLHALNRFALGNDWFEDPVRVFGQLSEVIFVALLAALFLGRGRWGSQSARRAAIAAGFAAVLGLAIAHGVTMIWDRPRPFEAHPGLHMFVARSGDPSFPSDHATAAFAIAVSVLLRNRRIGLVVLALAVAVALSRLAVGTLPVGRDRRRARRLRRGPDPLDRAAPVADRPARGSARIDLRARRGPDRPRAGPLGADRFALRVEQASCETSPATPGRSMLRPEARTNGRSTSPGEGGARDHAGGTLVPRAMHDVAEFLSAHDPFAALQPDELEDLAGRVQIEYFGAGATIFRQGEGPPDAMSVWRTGAIELRDDGRVLDLLGEGEPFGRPWMLSGLPIGWEARARESSLCYRGCG